MKNEEQIMKKRNQFDERECKWYTQYNGNRDYSVHEMKIAKLRKLEVKRTYPEQVRLLKLLLKGGHKNRQSLTRELPSILCCQNDLDRQQALQSLYTKARHSLQNDPSIPQVKRTYLLDKADKKWCALEWDRFDPKTRKEKKTAMKSWVDTLDI